MGLWLILTTLWLFVSSLTPAEETFLDWVLYQPSFLNVTIKNFKIEGRGLVTSQAVERHETLLAIPLELMFHPENSHLVNKHQNVLTTITDLSRSHQVAILLLLEKSDENSFWRPWFDVIPTVENFPVLISDRQIRRLSPLAARAWSLHNEPIQNLHKRLNRLHKQNIISEKYPLKEVQWASYIASTRMHEGGIYPLVDFTNHRNKAKVARLWRWDPREAKAKDIKLDDSVSADTLEMATMDGAIVLQALENLKSGEQVTLSYHDISKYNCYDWYMTWGFLPPNAPVKLQMPAPFMEGRPKLWLQHKCDQPVWVESGKKFRKDLMTCTRLTMLYNGPGVRKASWLAEAEGVIDFGRGFHKKVEQAAIKMWQVQLRSILNRFDPQVKKGSEGTDEPASELLKCEERFRSMVRKHLEVGVPELEASAKLVQSLTNRRLIANVGKAMLAGVNEGWEDDDDDDDEDDDDL